MPSGEKDGSPRGTIMSASCSTVMLGEGREIFGCGAKVVESQLKLATLLA